MNTVVQTRIDAKTKKEAELILKQLGLSLNDGIRMFISQVTLNKGIPFMPIIPRELNQESKWLKRQKKALTVPHSPQQMSFLKT